MVLSAPAIHQVLAGSAPGDAITHHAMRARELFRGWGGGGEVFAQGVHPALADQIHTMDRFAASCGPDDLVVVHYSIDSPAFGVAARHGARLVMHYHNITPAPLLWRHAPRLAAECARGRRRLPLLARRVVASLADSGYNADELAEAGYADPRAVGIFWPELPLPPAVERGTGDLKLLFVGRGIPNKAQHDLVLALAALLETGCPARLVLVGSWDMAPSYRDECMALARRLGVADRLEVAGSVTAEELGRHYREADVFVCLSDHEGFCVPLIEAIRAELPVVAYASSAIPETLGGAGLLLPDKRPSTVAEAILAVRDDADLRRALVAAGAERLVALGPEAVAGRLEAAFAGLR